MFKWIGFQLLGFISIVMYAIETTYYNLQEFYHSQLRSGVTDLPRIFGMTASPVKTKGRSFAMTASQLVMFAMIVKSLDFSL